MSQVMLDRTRPATATWVTPDEPNEAPPMRTAEWIGSLHRELLAADVPPDLAFNIVEQFVNGYVKDGGGVVLAKAEAK